MLKSFRYIVYSMFCVTLLAGCATTTDKAVTILENGQYFNGDSFVRFKELVIEGQSIQHISNTKSDIKGNRLDIKGKYIIPGLVDGHIHLSGSPSMKYSYVEPEYNCNSSLRCGVTTIIDLFYKEDDCRRLKAKTDKSPASYASLYLSGPMITAPGGHGTEYSVETRTITTEAEAIQTVNEVVKNGVDVIKVVYEAYSNKNHITLPILKAVVSTAHQQKIKVFAHINVAQEAVDCAEAGVDVLAHLPRTLLTEGQLSIIKQSGIVLIPTISVMYSYHQGHDMTYIADSLLWKTAHPKYLAEFNWHNTPTVSYKDSNIAKSCLANLESCIKNNIPILAGTDAGNYAVFYGYSLHDELRRYVLAGMSASEAINSASKNIKYVFPEKKTGIIAPGYDADMVILNANPLQDIRNTRSIYKVFHKGMQAQISQN